MELNKIVGALCSTLLVFLGLGFFAEQIFHPHQDEELAFALEIEDSGGGEEEEAVDIGTFFAEADPANGESVFKKCAACHKVEDGANGTGPYLYGVVGREIDTADGFDKYTGALLAVGESWTPENLFHFLENPRKVASGTSMGFAGLKDPQDRADVIAYLNQTDGSPEPLPEPAAATADGGDAAAEGEESGGDETPANEPEEGDGAEGEEAEEAPKE